MSAIGNRIRALLIGLALAAAAGAVPLLLFEATLTWFPGVLPRQVRAVDNRMETAVRWDETVTGDSYLGFRPKPDVSKTVKMDGVTAELRTTRMLADDVGFRDMVPAFDGPPADVAIGDSFTVCYGVSAADCWVSQLGRQAPRPIANLGVSGYSALAASRLLQRYGAAFRPRVVFHGLFLNDFDENLQFVEWERSGKENLRAWYHEQNLGEFGYRLYKRFRTYRLIRSLLRANRSQTYHMRDNGLNLYVSPTGWWVKATKRATDAEHLALMQRVLLDEQRAAQDMGARLVTLLFPFKEQVYWDEMVRHAPHLKDVDVDRPFRVLAEFCRDHGIPYVDVTDALRAHARAGEQLYFSMDAHWNPRGNAVAASAVSAALRAQGVL